MSSLKNTKAKGTKIKTDIVIIGGGGAGLAGAISAAEKGADVIVLEKRGALGGNSAFAFGLFAAESPVQKRKMIDCRRDDCFKIAMGYAHWRINPKIVRAFIDKSGDTIRWLEEKGVAFDCLPFYPNQVPTWHLPKGLGARMMKVMSEDCKKLGTDMLISTQAEKILVSESGHVTGVQAIKGEEVFRISSKSVIICTGGYGGNSEFLKKYSRDYQEGMLCAGLPHKGDGLIMATEIGSATEGLGNIMLSGPAVSPLIGLNVGNEPNTFQIRLMAIALEPNTIWVNKRGERFIDETVGFHHYESSNAVVRQPDNVCYTILDSELVRVMTEEGLILAMGIYEGAQGNKLPGLEGELRKQVDKGLVMVSDSLDELARWIGAEPMVLKETMNEYNACCDRGHDPIFVKNRKYLVPLRKPPYYAVKCGSGIMNTTGGIKINERMEVLDKQADPIPGVYAAGVDTGGWGSETYCDVLSGSAFGYAINSGRIAGENAAMFSLSREEHPK